MTIGDNVIDSREVTGRRLLIARWLANLSLSRERRRALIGSRFGVAADANDAPIETRNTHHSPLTAHFPMSPLPLLTYYCLLILLASIAGGMIPVWFRLTHRGMQFAVSFVAGVMLGVAVLHMLPHAVRDAQAADAAGTGQPVIATMWWLLAGVLAMFFIERFFCYHHHDVPHDPDHPQPQHAAEHDHEHESGEHSHVHDLSWSGAALGLALHSVLNGVALAASVAHGHDGAWLAGLGVFLVIFLHKPFDAMTIGMLMARGHWSLPWRHTVNALFALAIPVGVLLFHFGLMSGDSAAGSSSARIAAYALAFSAGTFLCISLSDLLPELQFHQHDRVKLSLALVFGLAVAIGIAQLESATHGSHSHGAPAAPANGSVLSPTQSSPSR
jgi:zinc and cadmium transporter